MTESNSIHLLYTDRKTRPLQAKRTKAADKRFTSERPDDTSPRRTGGGERPITKTLVSSSGDSQLSGQLHDTRRTSFPIQRNGRTSDQ